MLIQEWAEVIKNEQNVMRDRMKRLNLQYFLTGIKLAMFYYIKLKHQESAGI